MANRKRNIQMKFYVTEEEKWLIDGKMAQLPTRRYGAYLRKMAIDGYIIQLDTTDIKRMNATCGWKCAALYPSIAIFRRYAPYRRVGAAPSFHL